MFNFFKQVKGLFSKNTSIGLPFEQGVIVKIQDNFSVLEFQDGGVLHLQSNFEFFYDGREFSYNNLDQELVVFFTEHSLDKRVTLVERLEEGYLRIHLESGLVFSIEEGPFESWSYTHEAQNIYIEGKKNTCW